MTASTWNRKNEWDSSRLRLKFNGRAVDKEFAEDELLYFRFRHALSESRRIPQAAVRWPDDKGTSCNRSKYSEPQDVLFPCHYRDGVFSVPQDLVPGYYVVENGKGVEIRLYHNPTETQDKETGAAEENYAHCVMKNFGSDGDTRKAKSIRKNKALKTRVRALICESAAVLSEPVEPLRVG